MTWYSWLYGEVKFWLVLFIAFAFIDIITDKFRPIRPILEWSSVPQDE